MSYDPAKHHRRSIRLKGYDYTQSGWYFVTICTQHQQCLFGEIVERTMRLNEAGIVVQQWWIKLKEKFQNLLLDEYVIMPNHFHGIITITNPNIPIINQENTNRYVSGDNTITWGEHTGSPLHKIIQWFKTMTTNEYIRGVKSGKFDPFEKSLWQRNYYEHIIRNEMALYRIREYIKNNPANWKKDIFLKNIN